MHQAATPAPHYPARPPGLAFGGDYNPEQWPQEVWDEDVALMREAGVNFVNVGIFSWILMEPREGEYDFGWLDDIISRLHAADISVGLGTPTTVPPAWFIREYPGALPVTRDGRRIGFGGRESACSSSPEFRAATAALVERLARHYRDHPAISLWHVHNEYGAPLGECYCDASVAAWRAWLRRTYGELGALNEAWGTLFWGQRYGDWEEIDAPRFNHTVVNPAQRLDYARFANDEHLGHYRLQRDILRRVTPHLPVTTNFAGTISCKSMDLWRWAPELDVVANDHYLSAERPANHIELAMSADLARSLAGGRPWMIMEHSTGAVNWQPRNIAKRPGEMRRNSLAHVARGSDSVLFFQWRASRYGAEKFHSAMLPHGGTDTTIWREVAALGSDLGRLAEIRGSRVRADVAVAWDWESYWALELDWRPSVDLAFRERIDAFYGALWREHVTVDFVHPAADLSGYRLVVAPSLYLLTEKAGKNLRRYVESGGHLLVSFFSGIVDEHDAVHPGAHPGTLRDVLGVTVEEFHPLREGETVPVEDGLTGRIWSEHIRPAGAVTVREYDGGPDAGRPAITCHALGAGAAWYVSTALDESGLRDVLGTVLDKAGVDHPEGLPDSLEVIRRHAPAAEGMPEAAPASYAFLINHGDTAVTVPIHGTDLLDGSVYDGGAEVPAAEVVIVREDVDRNVSAGAAPGS